MYIGEDEPGDSFYAQKFSKAFNLAFTYRTSQKAIVIQTPGLLR